MLSGVVEKAPIFASAMAKRSASTRKPPPPAHTPTKVYSANHWKTWAILVVRHKVSPPSPYRKMIPWI